MPKRDVVRRLHKSASVLTRHLAFPLERYAEFADFGEANDAFLEAAVELGAQALLGALADAGLQPDEVDVIMSTTVTGLAVPSIEARIASVVGLRPDVKRIPLFGLGCLAGAAGLARLHDMLVGWPDAVGALVSVELCSLTLQRNDPSMANLVASGLFGDGAAAAIVVGERRQEPGPEIVASRSHLYPDTAPSHGLGLRSRRPQGGPRRRGARPGQHVPRRRCQRTARRPRPPGQRHRGLGRPPRRPEGPPRSTERPRPARLGAVGHLAVAGRRSATCRPPPSSTCCATRSTRVPPTPGTPGLLFAMGPGFCAELVLLRW